MVTQNNDRKTALAMSPDEEYVITRDKGDENNDKIVRLQNFDEHKMKTQSFSHNLWYFENDGNKFAIINNSTGQSICPAGPSNLKDMMYTQKHNKENCSKFQFSGKFLIEIKIFIFFTKFIDQ